MLSWTLAYLNGYVDFLTRKAYFIRVGYFRSFYGMSSCTVDEELSEIDCVQSSGRCEFCSDESSARLILYHRRHTKDRANTIGADLKLLLWCLFYLQDKQLGHMNFYSNFCSSKTICSNVFAVGLIWKDKAINAHWYLVNPSWCY